MPTSLPPLPTRPPVDLVTAPAPARTRPAPEPDRRTDDFRTALDDAVATPRTARPDAPDPRREAQPSRDDQPAESRPDADATTTDAAEEAPKESAPADARDTETDETPDPEVIDIEGLVIAPDALRIATRSIPVEPGAAVNNSASAFGPSSTATPTVPARSVGPETVTFRAGAPEVPAAAQAPVSDAPPPNQPASSTPNGQVVSSIAPPTSSTSPVAPETSGVASTTSGAVQVAAAITPPPVARPAATIAPSTADAPATDAAPTIKVDAEPAPPSTPAVARAATLNQTLAGPDAAAPDGAPITGADLAGRATFANLGDAQNAAQELRQSLLADDAGPDDVATKRIVRGMSTMISRNGGSMTMRLDPPELGQLKVQMTIARGVVTATFVASTDSARQLLERNIGMLRTSLENQGLTVERLAVQSTAASSSNGAATHGRDDPGQHQQQSSESRRDAANGESRGRREEGDQQRRERPRSFNEQFDDAAFREAMNDDGAE